MTKQEGEEIISQIIREVDSANKPLTLQELTERLEKPFIQVEACADRLLEAGRIQYIPAGGGNFGFIGRFHE